MLPGLLVVVFVGGAVILSGGMALYGLAFHGSEIAKLGLLWFVASILFGLGEEYTSRGYALRSLWRGTGLRIVSAILAWDHLEKPGENAMDIGMLFSSPSRSVSVFAKPARSGGQSAAVAWSG